MTQLRDTSPRYMPNKHMKRCLISYVIRESKIKGKMRYYSIHIIVTEIQLMASAIVGKELEWKNSFLLFVSEKY